MMNLYKQCALAAVSFFTIKHLLPTSKWSSRHPSWTFSTQHPNLDQPSRSSHSAITTPTSLQHLSCGNGKQALPYLVQPRILISSRSNFPSTIEDEIGLFGSVKTIERVAFGEKKNSYFVSYSDGLQTFHSKYRSAGSSCNQ